MNAAVAQTDSFADFLRVAAAILTLQAGFWLVVICGIMVVGWMLYLLSPIIFFIARILFTGAKFFAILLLIGLVFAAFGKPDVIVGTIFYTGYVVAKGVGTVVGVIIGV